MADILAQYADRLEQLARAQGLDYYPVDFEVVPPSFMLEVAIYGLPVRMPHWSFGVRYIYQLVQSRMGNSHIFEVVFPGNPNRAYLSSTNTLAENVLVTAHVLGHADFSRNNALFRRSQQQLGAHIVEQAAARAHRIEQAIDEFGQEAVEQVLDAALALEQYLDVNQEVNRPLFPERMPEDARREAEGFGARYGGLPGERPPRVERRARQRAPIPPRPEYDFLWFIAHYAPDMEDWERDIFLAVREESLYFYPVFACQIMNEGWAAYWHARLLREATFLPEQVYLDAIKSHSDVVSPFAAKRQIALTLNPYHLGFSIWERIVEEQGLEAARRIRDLEDDFGFVRNYLDAKLAEELQLFIYQAERSGRIEVKERDIDALHETLLAPKFNYGAPRIHISELRNDGGLVLRHEHETDGRGLDLERATKVLGYVHRVWRRPIILHTVDGQGLPKVLQAL
jgi:stage V sporulation protein R